MGAVARPPRSRFGPARLTAALAVAAVVLVPSLALLFTLFLRGRLDTPGHHAREIAAFPSSSSPRLVHHALLGGLPAPLHRVPAARPLRLGQPPASEVPIWVAALGRHTTRVAAELGDGWIPALVARDRLPAWAAQLSRLRETAVPHAQALTVAAGPVTAVDENADAARDIVAACIVWYLGAMGDVYSRSVSGQGYATEVRAILAANPRPSPQRGGVPPDGQIVLDQLAAYGTCDQVQQQLRPWDHAADIVTILLPPGMSWHNIEATLLAAAPGRAPEGGATGLATAAADRGSAR